MRLETNILSVIVILALFRFYFAKVDCKLNRNGIVISFSPGHLFARSVGQVYS